MKRKRKDGKQTRQPFDLSDKDKMLMINWLRYKKGQLIKGYQRTAEAAKFEETPDFSINARYYQWAVSVCDWLISQAWGRGTPPPDGNS